MQQRNYPISIRHLPLPHRLHLRLQVRGAPAIAIVGCLSLAVELTAGRQFDSAAALLAHVRRRLAHLVTSRPTAVNLQKAAAALLELAERTADSGDVERLRSRRVKESRAV